MNGKHYNNSPDQFNEAEKRAIVLFSTERMEDYLAILAVLVLLIIIAFLPAAQ